jgi:hypothetical protein
MKYFLFHITLFALLPALFFAQIPDTLWTKIYGGVDPDIGLSVQQTSDNGYIITGWTRSFGAGGADIYLIKTDSLGDTLWTRTYGGFLDDQGLSVLQTFDNGYIIAGLTSSYGAGDIDIYLVRTDSSGDTLWTGTYGSVDRDKGNAVLQIADGGFIVTGSYTWFGSADVSLMRVAPNNCPIWWFNYGGDYHDYGYAVQATSDGGYIITGETRSFGPGTPDKSNVYLIKTDVDGDTLWTRTFGGIENEVGYAVRQASDGGYIIVGSGPDQIGNPSILIIKTDVNGDSVWLKTYCGAEWANGYAVVETDDGGFLAAGETVDDIYLIKVNVAGDSLWTRTYGGDDIDAAQAIQKTFNNGYIVAGYTQSLTTNRDVWLARIEPDTFGIEDDNVHDLSVMDIRIVPNPFYHHVSIELNTTGNRSITELVVYDIGGRLVRDLREGFLSSNTPKQTTWNGCDNSGKLLPVGVYFLHVRQKNFSDVRKLILLR